MMFAEAKGLLETDPVLAYPLVLVLCAAGLIYLYMLVKNPDIYREGQRQRHERAVKKAEEAAARREQTNKAVSVGMQVLGWWLGKRK